MNQRAKISKAWREANRRKGICVGCTKPAQDGLALCRACRKRRADFQKKRIEERMCFRCSNPAAPGRKKCLRCVLQTALYDLQRKGLSKYERERAAYAFLAWKNECAACGEYVPDGDERFDHDDYRKRFRGIIHHGCNVAIGFVKESPERLEKLANYLKEKQRAI